MSARVWSSHQLAGFAEVCGGTGHVMIDAVAGSGKTTFLLECATRIDRRLSVAFIAFAKASAKELDARVACEHRTAVHDDKGKPTRCPKCTGYKPGFESVKIATLHSLGLAACRGARVDLDKGKRIAGTVVPAMTMPDGRPDPLRREWLMSTISLVGKAKATLAETPEACEDLIDLFEIEAPAGDRRTLIGYTLACLAAAANESRTVDYDDMVWLPVVLGYQPQQFDRVFVDETQDLNASQIALALRACKPGGRIVAVGDPRQAIYGFRGAADGAFQRVQKALNAKVLPLSVSYRCARAVVAEAQTIVPHLEAAPGAVAGSVQHATMKDLYEGAGVGDFVLSRTNAPLMSLCLHFLRNGVAAAVQGRNVGDKLVSEIRKSRDHGSDSASLMLVRLDAATAREVERLTKRDAPESTITTAEDVRDCIHALAEGETSCEAICRKVDSLFRDDKSTSRITLSSTHRAKGMERHNVWLLRDTYMRARGGQRQADGSRGAPSPPSLEERNLYYVACTRAMVNLYLVRGEPKA